MATSLSNHVAELEEWLRKRDGAPQWDDVKIVLDSDIQHDSVSTIAVDSINSPTEFSAEFAKLVDRGYRWINLSGLGVLNGALMISVELPRQGEGTPPQHVSVNYSGPKRSVSEKRGWDLAETFELL